MENKILIDSVNNLKVALNEISVYDFDVYTSMELYYKIAENFNKVIKELSRFEGVISEEIVKQNEKLIYLLGEGLNQEVVNKIDNMVETGVFDTIINHNIFNNLKNDIKNVSSQLDHIINDNITSNKSSWSSNKIKEQIALIPKGDKGEPGTASTSIDDLVVNKQQTWTSFKMLNENNSILNDSELYENQFIEINGITNGDGQIIFMYDLGENHTSKILDFKCYLYSNENLGNISINVFCNNSEIIHELAGGYSLIELYNNYHNTNDILKIPVSITTKDSFRYLKILVKIEKENPHLFISQNLKYINTNIEKIGIGGYNIIIENHFENKRIDKQLINFNNLEKKSLETNYFNTEMKKLKENNRTIKLLKGENDNIKTFYTIVFELYNEKETANLEISYKSEIDNKQFDKFTIQIYNSDNINNDSISDTILSPFEYASLNFTKKLENVNLLYKKYIKVIVGVDLLYLNKHSITFSDISLKIDGKLLNIVNFGFYTGGENGKTTIIYDDKDFVNHIELQELKDSISKDFNKFWVGKTLMSFGDSITWRDGKIWDVYDNIGEIARGYQTVAKEILGLNSVINNGVSDTTISNIGAGKGSMWNQFFSNGCPNLDGVDIITIAHGTNDYASNSEIGEIGGIDLSQSSYDVTTFYGAYRDILDKIINNYPNVRIVLCTPIQKRMIYANNKGYVLNDYREAIINLGKLYSLPVCDFYGECGINYLNHASFYPDGVHPNDDGYELMGRRLASTINQI